MNFSVTNLPSDQITLLRQASVARAYATKTEQPKTTTETSLPAIQNAHAKNSSSGTRLLNETSQELSEGGYRRTRIYEREDGRNFTKVEEFALTERGARKTIIQQNPSGSITQYEEVLDREASGNFRRTQRFQDESGDVSTNITTGYKVLDPFILSGGTSYSYTPSLPSDSTRGTQLDLVA